MERPSITSRSVVQTFGIALGILVLAAGAEGGGGTRPVVQVVLRQADRAARHLAAWYERTPPSDRICWGGLVACAGLGLGVVLERLSRLRRRRVLPASLMERFLGRLRDGKLDPGKALDYCEVNPSPAARVALAAVRRWGRPVGDLERAVALACRIEADRLRRNVATLRRIAALAPLIGLLGSLGSAARNLAALGGAPQGAGWSLALAHALGPLTAGVALGTLALVLYDGLAGKVEKLSGSLDRLGAEVVDAIALAMPAPSPTPPVERRHPGAPPVRPPHPYRTEVPEPLGRHVDPDDELV